MARQQRTTKRPEPRKRSPRRAAIQAAATESERHIVYVHGICRHLPGYSDPWWAAMKPHVAGIPDENRHEVLWSDVVTPEGRPPPSLHSPQGLAARLAQAGPPSDPAEA